jgi:hypothetical protein
MDKSHDPGPATRRKRRRQSLIPPQAHQARKSAMGEDQWTRFAMIPNGMRRRTTAWVRAANYRNGVLRP